MKKEKRLIIFIHALTILICICLFVCIAVPHHLTEQQAIKYVDQYIKDRSINRTFEFSSIESVYISDDGMEIKYASGKGKSDYKFNLIQKIWDYWNPNLRFWHVSFIQTNTENKPALYTLSVDSYTGFVKEGSVAIAWER